MMEKFYELMAANNIATYVQEDPTIATPLLGEAFFPAVKVDGLELTYIKDAKGLPVALKPSQFDANAPIRDRMSVQATSHDMPFFREGMVIGEKERQDLFKALSRTPEAYRVILNRIYDDSATLVSGANAQAERMRMQLLSTGKIAITANSEYLDYDFALPKEHVVKLEADKVWTNPDADILGFIETAKETVADSTGATLTTMLMTKKTFNLLRTNKQIKSLLNPLAVQSAVVTAPMVQGALEQATEMKIVTYDKRFRDEEGNTQKFFPDNVVAFLPDGTLGNTNYGTTPEEFDLMSSTDHRANVSVVNTGVAITTYKQEHPVNSKTIVSQIVMPSFEQADNVFIATVAEDTP